MSARVASPVSGVGRYAVVGEPGTWRYVGQATYVDESTGATVEHDHVRMVEVGGDREVWVPAADVSPVSGAVSGAA